MVEAEGAGSVAAKGIRPPLPPTPKDVSSVSSSVSKCTVEAVVMPDLCESEAFIVAEVVDDQPIVLDDNFRSPSKRDFSSPDRPREATKAGDAVDEGELGLESTADLLLWLVFECRSCNSA